MKRTAGLGPACLCAILVSSGCSALFDGDRHTGGSADGDAGTDAGVLDAKVGDGGVDAGPDAGPCDEDGDGVDGPQCGGTDCDDTQPDVYPGAPPVCNDGLAQGCPTDPPLDTSPFGSHAVAGVLPMVELFADPVGYGPEVAIATATIGGASHGTAVVLGMQIDGAFQRLVRADVPLHAIDSPAVVAVHGATGVPGEERELSAFADVRGIALRNADADKIAVALLGTTSASESMIGWSGFFDFVSGDSPLRSVSRMSTSPSSIAWPQPAILQLGMAWRERATPPILAWYGIGDPPTIGLTDTNVPTGEARMMGSDGQYGMIQPGDGRTCFFRPNGGEVGCSDPVSEGGKIAFEQIGTTYLTAGPTGGGVIVFNGMECSGDTCVPMPIASSPPMLNTGAPRAEALDMAERPPGGAFVLVLEHYAGGDRVTLQPIAESGDIEGARIELLDLRGESRRVLDGDLSIVTTVVASTVAVTLSLGETFADTADSIVFTGVRACVDG